MNYLPVILLALSMSSDAFAAALGKGAVLDRPNWREALRTGLIFGTIEAITPVIGWALGRAASSYIAAFDHWIAFGLLVAIGGKMIWDSFQRDANAGKAAAPFLPGAGDDGDRHQHRCPGGRCYAGADRRQYRGQRAGDRDRDIHHDNRRRDGRPRLGIAFRQICGSGGWYRLDRDRRPYIGPAPVNVKRGNVHPNGQSSLPV